MASYQIRYKRKNRYICHVTAFRNKEGKPDNKKLIIGKLDENDNVILNKNYLDFLIQTNKNINHAIYEISLYLFERGKINKVTNKDDEQELDEKLFVATDYLRKFFDFNDDMTILPISDKTTHISSRQFSSGQTLSFGNIFLLEKLCQKIGLTQILTQVFPKSYDKILTLL
jgi:hypothetical protein